MFKSLRFTLQRSANFTATTTKTFRPFTTTYTFRMPEQLKAEEVNSKTDPSVAKQWDNDVSTEKKFEGQSTSLVPDSTSSSALRLPWL